MEVEGYRDADSIVVAEEIEVRSSSGGCDGEDGDDDAGELEFYGVIQSLPPDGLLGAWLIGGRTVLVGSFTEIDLDGLPAAVGVCVEAEGFLLNGGVIQAESSETEDSGAYCGSGSDTPSLLEFHGLVEALPGGGLLGAWQVGGQTIIATAATECEAEGGPFALGACVSVEARLLPDGSLEAVGIETEDDPSECTKPPYDEDVFEFRGLVQAVPGAGLSGNWTIGFLSVVVTESTEIEEQDGPLLPGACVEVEAQLGPDGTLTAEEIEVESSSGTCLSSEGVVDGAAFAGGAVAPGQIVSLFGLAVGPLDSRSQQVRDGRVTSDLSNTRVLFDGVPAPLIFVSVNQINAVVPYSVDGKAQTQVQIERGGGWSNVITLDVVPASPGLFTLTQMGEGQAAALNFEAEDDSYTLNSDSNPVDRGGIIVLYAAGGGQTDPPGTDGLVIEGTLPRPKLSVSVSIGGEEGEVLYAGAAPGFVSGLLQINVRVPIGIAAGPLVPVAVNIGGFSSQAGVTVAVR